MMKKTLLLVTVGLLVLAATTFAQDYAGVDKCKMCHMQEYREWSKTAHAEDFSSVGEGDSARDLYTYAGGRCLACHVVGYGEEGGYDPEKPHTEQEELLRIQCESCHGPGAEHVASGGRKPTVVAVPDSRATCNACHTTSFKAMPVAAVGDKDVARGPHHPQSLMLNGVGGYEYAGKRYPKSPHAWVVADQCVTCHMNPEEPHSLEADLDSCRICHGFSLEDFNVAGAQTEIEELLHELEGYLENAADQESIEYLRANYNFHLVEADASHGVHNFFYARQLLMDSIANKPKQK